MTNPKLILCNDPFSKLETLKNEHPFASFYYPQLDDGAPNLAGEIKINQAREIIQKAMFVSEEPKFIFMISKYYSIEAQNALLKILEEPPENINFVLLAPSKNTLLKTLLSRLEIINNLEKIVPLAFPLDLKSLSYDEIYEFLKNAKNFNRDETHQMIQSLLFAVKDLDLNLSASNLACFDLSIKSNANYHPGHLILLPLLLMIRGCK